MSKYKTITKEDIFEAAVDEVINFITNELSNHDAWDCWIDETVDGEDDDGTSGIDLWDKIDRTSLVTIIDYLKNMPNPYNGDEEKSHD